MEKNRPKYDKVVSYARNIVKDFKDNYILNSSFSKEEVSKLIDAAEAEANSIDGIESEYNTSIAVLEEKQKRVRSTHSLVDGYSFETESGAVVTPDPVDPNPTNPNPTDPNPVDPNPTDSNPTDPNPVDPNPTDPEPPVPDVSYPDTISAANQTLIKGYDADNADLGQLLTMMGSIVTVLEGQSDNMATRYKNTINGVKQAIDGNDFSITFEDLVKKSLSQIKSKQANKNYKNYTDYETEYAGYERKYNEYKNYFDNDYTAAFDAYSSKIDSLKASRQKYDEVVSYARDLVKDFQDNFVLDSVFTQSTAARKVNSAKAEMKELSDAKAEYDNAGYWLGVKEASANDSYGELNDFVFEKSENVSITVTIQTDSDIAGLEYSESGETVTFTAPSGHGTYSWSVDGVLQDSDSNTLSIDKTPLSAGLHNVLVVVDGKYSARCVVKVVKK